MERYSVEVLSYVAPLSMRCALEKLTALADIDLPSPGFSVQIGSHAPVADVDH